MCVFSKTFRYFFLGIFHSPFIVRAESVWQFKFVGAGGGGAYYLDIGFRHMFSALDLVSLGCCMCRAVRFPPCACTDASHGVESLVDRNSPNHLGHASWCRFFHRAGATRNRDYTLSCNLSNYYKDLFSTVIK